MDNQATEVDFSNLVQQAKKENITGVRIILGVLGFLSMLGILFAYGEAMNPNYTGTEDSLVVGMINAFAPIVSLMVCFHLMGERKPRAMRTIAKTKIITWLVTVVAAFIFIGGQASAMVLITGSFATIFWVAIVSIYAVSSKSYKQLYQEENV